MGGYHLFTYHRSYLLACIPFFRGTKPTDSNNDSYSASVSMTTEVRPNSSSSKYKNLAEKIGQDLDLEFKANAKLLEEQQEAAKARLINANREIAELKLKLSQAEVEEETGSNIDNIEREDELIGENVDSRSMLPSDGETATSTTHAVSRLALPLRPTSASVTLSPRNPSVSIGHVNVCLVESVICSPIEKEDSIVRSGEDEYYVVEEESEDEHN